MEETKSGQLLKFQTSDGQDVLAPRKLFERSITVKNLLDDNPESDEPIPLPEITKATIEKVIEYLKHIEEGNAPPEIEKPLRSSDLRDVTTEYYADFINHEHEIVEDIILAANYLDIKDLLALGCAKLGSIIRGLTIPEFRKKFNIVNDFTPAEEAEPFDEAKIAELAEAYEKQQQEEEKKLSA